MLLVKLSRAQGRKRQLWHRQGTGPRIAEVAEEGAVWSHTGREASGSLVLPDRLCQPKC